VNGLTIVSILRCAIIHKTIHIVTEIYFDIGKDTCVNLFILNNYISFLYTEIYNRKRNRGNDNNKKRDKIF